MASRKQNTTLTENSNAPEFTVHDLAGEERTLSGIANGLPVVLIFFKITCPTCHYTFPFFERLYQGRTNREIGMYAISQDDPESTLEFYQEFNFTLPTFFDREDDDFPASTEYGVWTVPTVFLVEADRRISMTLMGFEKKGLQELGRRLGVEPFEAGDNVPDFRPGCGSKN